MLFLKTCIRILVLLLILPFSACMDDYSSPLGSCIPRLSIEKNKNETVLDQNQEEFYFNIWKERFLSQSGMTDMDFKKHIQKVQISSHYWAKGITFSVNYVVHWDWIKVPKTDEFIVKFGDTDAYQWHGIPQDELLDKKWTLYCIDNEINRSAISGINWKGIKTIDSKSCLNALRTFRDSCGYPVMEIDRISFYVPGKVPRIDGDLYLIGKGTISDEDNKCLSGYFNLISRKHKVWITACWQS